MRNRLALLPALLGLALFLPACGGGDDTTAAQGGTDTTATKQTQPTTNPPAPSGEAVRSAKVEMVDFSFKPTTVTIQAGGKVIWQNEGQVAHTATANDGSFDTGTVQPGKLASEAETFKTPGTISYHCTIHPQMTGTIKVVESG
jgi:plastocyanin